MLKYLLTLFIITQTFSLTKAYWQQEVQYVMDVSLNNTNHTIKGKQTITYTNNSPDKLDIVYFHLYFNAFQPNSQMDTRSRQIIDPDKRVGDRIFYLKQNEIGFQNVSSVKQDGKILAFEIRETIMLVRLSNSILPGKSAKFELEFEAQIPVQIRRSGRNNSEGIEYSMSQWYPKICQYDEEGWHTNQYIGKEFYGVYGDFDVNITIDSAYTIAATGILLNPNEIGKGYVAENEFKRKKGKTITWQFRAEKVHDFVWAADRKYTHITYQAGDVLFRMFYVPDSLTTQHWPNLGKHMHKALDFMNQNFGKYPYKQYCFIQGGDGGMEYPMATLITGRRPLSSLVGVSVHEMVHSWFQGVLAFNESKYYWMDEGFTEYASALVMNEIFPAKSDRTNGLFKGYLSIAGTQEEQPLTTHADWFETNKAYGISAYSKGAVFLLQLRYLIGDDLFQQSMLTFFERWKFKHPKPNDLKRIAESLSGMQLSWYFDLWLNTTNTIDYTIKSALVFNDTLTVNLERNGLVPMPIELGIIYEGDFQLIYVPLDLVLGDRKEKLVSKNLLVSKQWRWVDKEYKLTIPIQNRKIQTIVIDPLEKIADVNRDNNFLFLHH
jgi:hypothetical protein